ncbi:MAG TPA: hypothetical protein VML50_00805 [Anaeromyxobacter sp.]|nr:hypothetical protein [Anaeromyxobacter sp.]
MAACRTPSQRGSASRGLLTFAAIAGLLALVAWLASERNARTWYLVPDEGRLVVMKGMLLPYGRQAFKPSDPTQAQAYAPLVFPPGKALPEERSFEERSMLDQALYDLLAGWAREDVQSGDPARMERGLGFLARAERLAGISPAQRDDLTALRAESGYQEARRLLDRAAGELREAAEKLRLTAASRSPHAVDAQALLHPVEGAVEQAAAAARAATPPGPEAARPAEGAPPAPPDAGR